MDVRLTQRFTVLLIIGNIFQDIVSSGIITVDMPPVVSVFEGDDVELECKVRYANGTLVTPCDERHGLTLRWSLVNRSDEVFARCGRGVPSFKNKTVEFNQDNGNLTILDIGLADDTVFECFVYGPHISHTNTTRVDVKKANFGVEAENILTLGEGGNVSLSCSVIDSGTTDQRSFTFVWSLNNTILQSCNPSSDVIDSVDQTGKYALHHGKTSCNITILNLNLKDEGRYQCDVHDAFYNQSNNNSTTIVIASKPLSTAATNYISDGGSTNLKSLTLKTTQGFETTSSIGLDLIIVLSASGLSVIAIGLIVVALRLHRKRFSAIPKSQSTPQEPAMKWFVPPILMSFLLPFPLVFLRPNFVCPRVPLSNFQQALLGPPDMTMQASALDDMVRFKNTKIPITLLLTQSPQLCTIRQSNAIGIIIDRGISARTNSSGDRESPWKIPLLMHTLPRLSSLAFLFIRPIVLITALLSSGLFLVAISLMVVASRLRKDRHSAVQINQTNDANRATVTFRRAPSPGSIRIGPNLSSRFKVQGVISSGIITIDMPPVVTVFEGEDVELECKARYANGTLIPPCDERHGLTLQWISGDEIARCGRVVSFKNKTVEFNPDNGNLTILEIGLADEAMVRCTVNGLVGRYSNMTHLKVQKGVISSGAITIDMPPVVSVFEGEDVELECKARYADGTLIPACDERHGLFRWSLVSRLGNMPGDEIARCGRVASFKNKTVEFNQDSGNLTILDIGLADDAVFECFVYGPHISHTNTTRVEVKKANFGVQAENILTPGEGEDVSLPCSVIDSGTTDQRSFTFEWSLNNAILQSCNPSGEVIYSVDQTGKYALHHGKTSCNLTIINLSLKDEGRYQCDVRDSFYNQSNYSSTTIVVASEPSLITTLPAETNFNGGVKSKIVTLKTGQGSGDTPLESARKDAVLITAVSSGLFLVAISLLVVASRLRKDRHTAVHINQTNDANRATVTFRRAPSPGSIQIGPNLSSRFEQRDAETAYAEVGEIGDHATSTTDNHNVITHTYAESRLNLAEIEDEAPSPPPPPRGILYPPLHWLWQ
ncbi:uncharacterized protein [Asterias amurensis]|uniref:uncharacterized protein n=1 Tax=Asterias amurensis TaxID=7602 RepID=UPI003AB5CAB5